MTITKQQIEKLEAGFYLFTTANCPTCEKLKMALKELDLEYEITEVDAYAHQNLCVELSLIGTPCLIDYRDNREYDRMYGAPSSSRIQSFLKGE